MNLANITESCNGSSSLPSFPFDTYVLFSKTNQVDKPSLPYHLRELQGFETGTRRDVDIMESIDDREKQSIKLHFVNGEDPTFKVRFSELPELVVDLFVKNDVDPTLYSISDEPHQTMSFYDALMTASEPAWLAVVDARKKVYIDELKDHIWRDMITNRHFAKRNYGASFSYDEMQSCLKPQSQDITTAGIVATQDFFNINLVIIHEEDGHVRFHKSMMCRAFYPYVIMIVRGGLFRAIVKKDGLPSLFRYSSHMPLLQMLLKDGLPPNTQKLGVNLKPLKIAKVRQVAEAIGIPTVKDGKKLTKDAILDKIEAHKFTDDEVKAVKDCLD